MKTASAALISLLNSSTNLAMADLFTFTLPGGSTIAYTSAELPVTVGGSTWPVGPLIKRTGINWKIGVEVDTLQVTIEDDGSNTVGGVPILQYIVAGALDGARLTVRRAFGASYGAWTDSLFLFSGLVSSIKVMRNSAEISVKSELVLLDARIPRNVFQSRCLNVVFDGTCGLAASAYTVSSSIASVSSNSAFSAGGIAQATGYWDQGYVTFTSGANIGLRRTIKTYTAAGNFLLIQPLPIAPTVGDTFTVLPGCDGAQSTCSNKFANSNNYRGLPFIPVAETVL